LVLGAEDSGATNQTSTKTEALGDFDKAVNGAARVRSILARLLLHSFLKVAPAMTMPTLLRSAQVFGTLSFGVLRSSQSCVKSPDVQK
jgi:hypothetical protein